MLPVSDTYIITVFVRPVLFKCKVIFRAQSVLSRAAGRRTLSKIPKLPFLTALELRSGSRDIAVLKGSSPYKRTGKSINTRTLSFTDDVQGRSPADFVVWQVYGRQRW